MGKNIGYTDNQDRVTLVDIYQPNTTTTDYEFCGTGEPVNLKWFGEQYSTVNGSECFIRILVQNETDQTNIRELFTGGQWFVNITKDGSAYWKGKLMTQFYTESYGTFPYEIELNASDQLGQLKDYQFLMTDFPVPFNTQGGFGELYSALDIILKLLTDTQIQPALAPNPSVCPQLLNVASSLGVDSEYDTQVLEKIKVNPLIFMDDETKYVSKSDVLDTLLKPLNMKLFQWYNQYYLISNDVMLSAATYSADRYLINYTNQTAIYFGNYDLNLDIIQPFNVAYPRDTQPINDNATMEYIPAIPNLIINEDYQENKNAIYGFTNNEGGFYSGDNGIPLEFNEGGTDLQYYTPDFGGITTTEYIKNEGLLRTNLQWNPNLSSRKYVDTYLPLNGNYDILYFNIKQILVTIAPDVYVEQDRASRFSLSFYREGNPTTYRVERNLGGEIQWNKISFGSVPNESTIRFDVTNDIDFNLNINLNELLDEGTGDIIMRFSIYQPESSVSSQGSILSKIKIKLASSKLEAAEYKYSQDILITNETSQREPEEIDIIWGSPTYTAGKNESINHYSTPIDEDGEPINEFYHNTYAFTQDIPTWIYYKYLIDRSSTSKLLNLTFKSNEYTPLNCIYDADGEPFRFINGELDDLNGVWKNEYIELKGYLGGSQVVKGDFSPQDFNDDFYKTD